MLDRLTHRAEAAEYEYTRAAPPITQAPLGARPIETGGWDVVSAVRIREINEAIENAGTSPEGFEQDAGDGVTIRAKFAPWRVGPDGEGSNIDLDIGLHDIEYEKNGEVTKFSSAMAVVRVFLKFLPTGKNGLFGAAPTQEFALVLNTGVDKHRMMADKDATPAKVVEIIPGEDMKRARVYLKIAIQKWMNANLDQFHHVFATVNLVKISTEDAKGTAFSWMMPNEVGYAFARSNAAPENSVLAILCQTGGRTSEGLALQAQADIITPGTNGALTISKQRLVRDMLQPGIAQTFEGLKESDMRYRANDGGLSLEKPVTLKAITHKGKTYDPILHKFDIVLRDTELAIETKTKVTIDPGVRSVCQSVARYTFGLTTNKSGEKTLGFKVLQEPSESHEIEKDKARDIGEFLTSIGLAIFGALALMSGPAGWMALGLCAVCLVGRVHAWSVDKYKSGDSPPIDLLLANATTAVSWSTGTRFDPSFAALNGGLQIAGTLGAPSTESLVNLHRAFQAPHRKMMMMRMSKPGEAA